MNKKEWEVEDKKLYEDIIEVVGDTSKAEKITNICLDWVDDQLSWGGKYDYLLEQICGEDA